MIKFEIVKNEFRWFPDVEIKLPVRADKGSAGHDFYSLEEVGIAPGEQYLFWTDIKAQMNDNNVLQIYPRSSLGVKGLILANTVGIIDQSYYGNSSNDGNIGICLRNVGDKPYIIKKYERIAQGIFIKYDVMDDEEENNNERCGGFGSSNGRNNG